MGKFDRGGFGGGKKFGGRDRSFDRDAPRQMHKATCAECGNECEVPFKPSGDRPVLCSLCFKNSGRGEERSERRDDRREERGSFDRPRGDKPMFDATCAECGQACQVPFRPSPGKDVFCSDCFGRDDKRESKPFASSNNQAPAGINYEKHFEKLRAKLDRLIALLTPNAPAAVNKPVVAKAVEVKKIEKKTDKKSTFAKATVDKSASAKAPVDKSASAKAPVDKAEKKVASKKKVSKKK